MAFIYHKRVISLWLGTAQLGRLKRERAHKRDKEIEEIIRRYAEEKEKREQEIRCVNSEHSQLIAPREEARQEVEGGSGFYDGVVNVLSEVGKHSVNFLLKRFF